MQPLNLQDALPLKKGAPIFLEFFMQRLYVNTGTHPGLTYAIFLVKSSVQSSASIGNCSSSSGAILIHSV